MKYLWRFYGLVWLFLLTASVLVQADEEAVDSTGQIISLHRPAQRIISLAPHTTEILFAIGAGERVVGVVSYSDYPQQALQLPKVGSNQAFDYEAIVALEPDLILAWQSGNPATSIEKLRQMGYPVFITEPRTLEDIPALLRNISKLTATQHTAETVAHEFSERLGRLRKHYADTVPLKVFFQIWQQPLMTVSTKHIINQVIELCGGVNIFDQQDTLAATVDIEGVIVRNPDVIIINGQGGRFDEWQDYWRQWQVVNAVRDGFIYQVNPDITSRHTPRLITGAEQLCRLLDQARTEKKRLNSR